MTRVARREWPPREKKLSSRPMGDAGKTCVQMSTIISSTGVRGGVSERAGSKLSGAGKLRRSSLPLLVSGSFSSST